MNDDDRLEARLRALRPAGVRAELMERVQESLDERLTTGERILAAWAGMGAVAAAAIVTVLVWQLATTTREMAIAPAEITAQQQIVLENNGLLALR